MAKLNKELQAYFLEINKIVCKHSELTDNYVFSIGLFNNFFTASLTELDGVNIKFSNYYKFDEFTLNEEMESSINEIKKTLGL